MIIKFRGEVFTVFSVNHRTPGNKRGFVQAKMRSRASGAMIEHKFSSEDFTEKVELHEQSMEYLYEDGDYHFMNTETYEQISISKEDLGGYQVHARSSGVVDNDAEDEQDLMGQIRAFLSYLPTNVHQLPPIVATDDPVDRREEGLVSIVPRHRNRGYSPRKLIEMVVDRGSFFELNRYYGRSQVTGFARIAGMPVGVLGNDPMHYGGAMGAPEARKFERFVDMCDVFHLPIVNFADQPGFLIGRPGEGGGALRAGVRAACAIDDSQVPWATVVVRRLYGVAGGAHQDFSRFCFRVAWPSAEWGSIPIEGGVAAAYRREIEAAEDPAAHRAEIEERLIALRSPFSAAEAFAVEDIIDPRDTRWMLAEWLEIAYAQQLPAQLGVRVRYGMRP